MLEMKNDFFRILINFKPNYLIKIFKNCIFLPEILIFKEIQF